MCNIAALSLGLLLVTSTLLAKEQDAPMNDKQHQTVRVYVGTYSRAPSKGIYVLELDLAEGKLSEARLATEAVNPSFLAIHPTQKYLYAVSEIEEHNGKKTGAVAAYTIDALSGKLTELNREASGGAGPCHVTVDREGKTALVANYGAGSVASLPINADGTLGDAASVFQHKGRGPRPDRQEGPHAHSANIAPNNQLAIVADLGLDQLLLYKIDNSAGKLTPSDPPYVKVADGAGPRHFTFHPNSKLAYVINELDSTITVLEYDASKHTFGTLQSISTLPEDFNGNNTTAEVQVHPSGKFLYGSNRGHDSIAMFTIDQNSGHLTATGHVSSAGKTPRNFAIDPTGQYLIAANQDTDNIALYRIDAQSGQLTPTGQSLTIGAPVCVKFMQIAAN